MADAILVTVAEAIASAIRTAMAAGDFAPIADAEIDVLWSDQSRVIELDKANVLRISVAPTNWTMRLSADGMWTELIRCEVGIRKRFDVADQDQSTGAVAVDEIKSLVTLLSDLIKFFSPKQPDNDGRRLSSVPSAVWMPENAANETVGDVPKIDAMIDWEALRDAQQFLGWFALVYEVDT